MGECRYSSTHICNLGKKENWVVSSVSHHGCFEKECQYPLGRRLGVSQRWTGHSGKEKNLSPCQKSNPHHLGSRESLCRLSYPLAKCMYVYSRFWGFICRTAGLCMPLVVNVNILCSIVDIFLKQFISESLKFLVTYFISFSTWFRRMVKSSVTWVSITI
jgi:hypothetical protein